MARGHQATPCRSGGRGSNEKLLACSFAWASGRAGRTAGRHRDLGRRTVAPGVAEARVGDDLDVGTVPGRPNRFLVEARAATGEDDQVDTPVVPKIRTHF